MPTRPGDGVVVANRPAKRALNVELRHLGGGQTIAVDGEYAPAP